MLFYKHVCMWLSDWNVWSSCIDSDRQRGWGGAEHGRV